MTAVLTAIAKELAEQAKKNLPKLQDNEVILKEWYEDGIFYRDTKLNDEIFRNAYDFRQRKSRRMAITNR